MNLGVLLGYARPYRVTLAFCISLMLLETAAALAVPWLGGQFASGVLSQARVDMSSILLGLLSLFAFQALLKFANGYVLSRTAACISGRSAHPHLRPLTGIATELLSPAPTGRYSGLDHL